MHAKAAALCLLSEVNTANRAVILTAERRFMLMGFIYRSERIRQERRGYRQYSYVCACMCGFQYVFEITTAAFVFSAS